MKIRWEGLIDAERGWKLNDWKREQIFENCLRGERVSRFPWKRIGMPIIYVGAALAVCLAMILIWPLFKQPIGEKVVVLEGSSSEASPAPFEKKEDQENLAIVPHQKEEEKDPSKEEPETPAEKEDPKEESETPAEKEDPKEESETPAEKEDPKEEPETPAEKEDPKEEAEEEETIVARVEQTDSRELELLTGGTIGETLDYEVYYCGIKNFYITVDGKEIELRKALVKYPNMLDDLYAEWKQGVNHPYYDGGSVEYPRATYTAIKLKTTYIGETGYMQRMNDLIICATDMTLNKVDDLIEEIYAAKKPNLLTTPKLGKRYDSDDYVIDPGKDLINEATAIKIARQFFLDEYGAENAAAFSKVDCRFDKAGTDSEGRYHVVFYYPLGEGGFINGPYLTILISERGGVMQSFPSEGIKNFDLNLLEGWSRAKLKRKLMKQLTDRFGNKATDLTMESIRLEQNESGTYLRVDTDALIDWELSHDGHKGVYFSYHFETAAWEEPTYCG